jgi:hypothetical protein
MPISAEADLRDGTERSLAAELRIRAPACATEIAHRIHAEVPEFESRAVTLQTTDAVRALILAFARTLSRGPAVEQVDVPTESLEYIRAFVRRGFDLELLLRVHHLGHRELWALSAELLEADGHTEDQRAISVRLFDFMAILTRRVVEEFAAERRRWVRSSDALRAEIVRGIIGGVPISVEDSSARLRYDLGARHLALVAWSADDSAGGGGAIPALTRLLPTLRRPSLVIAAGARTAFAWIAVREDPDAEMLELIRGDRQLAGLGVALGEPARGIAGFRSSHLDALAARRVAVISGERLGKLVRWADVAGLALLSADPDQARRFASRELGALDAEDDGAARLRATLAAFLEENDRQRTAARLGVHPNTVAYRLRQCEELLRRPIGERRFELAAALRLRDRAQLSLAVSTRTPPPPAWPEAH